MGIFTQTRQIAGGSIFLQVLSLVIFLVLTRQLGAYDYGIYASVLALSTTVLNFSSQWLTPFIIAHSAKQFDRDQSIGPHYLYPFSVANLLVLIGVTLAFFFSKIKIGDELEGWFPLFLLLLSTGMLWVTLNRSLFQSLQHYQSYANLLWLDKMIMLIGLGVLYFSEQLTIFNVLWLVGSAFIIAGLLSGLKIRQFAYRKTESEFNLKQFSKDTFPVLLSVIALYFSSPAFTTVLAGYFYGAESAGYLGVAFVIFGFLLFPLRWITPLLLPRFSIDLDNNDERSINEFLDHYLFIFLFIYALGLMVLLPLLYFVPIIELLLGDEYIPAVLVILMVLSSVVAELVISLSTQVFYSKSQNRFVLSAMVVKSVCFVIGVALIENEVQLAFVYSLSCWLSAGFCIYALKQGVDMSLMNKFLLLFTMSVFPYWLAGRGEELALILILAIVMCVSMVYLFFLIKRAAHPGTFGDFFAKLVGKT